MCGKIVFSRTNVEERRILHVTTVCMIHGLFYTILPFSTVCISKVKFKRYLSKYENAMFKILYSLLFYTMCSTIYHFCKHKSDKLGLNSSNKAQWKRDSSKMTWAAQTLLLYWICFAKKCAIESTCHIQIHGAVSIESTNTSLLKN